MFDVILRELIDSIPGARGAVFCDGQGESVNAIGASGRHDNSQNNDYELRVAGAQLATPLDQAYVNAIDTLGQLRECIIGGAQETLLIHTLPDGYYLVLCLAPGVPTARAMHYLRQSARRVILEM